MIMENKKKTKKEMYMELLALEEVRANETMVEFINHEIELLSKSRKSDNSKSRKEYEELKVKVLEYLEKAPKSKTSDIARALNITSQKATPTLGKMVEENLIVREVVKGTPLFSVVE